MEIEPSAYNHLAALHLNMIGEATLSDIVVTVPADASADTVARVKAAFPDAAFQDPAAAAAADHPSNIASFENAIAAAVGNAKDLPAEIGQAWTNAGGAMVLVWILIALAAAYAVERAFKGWLNARHHEPPAITDTPSFRERAAHATRFAVVQACGLAVFALMAVLVGRGLPFAGEEARVFARGVLRGVLFARVIYLFIDLVVAPYARERRLMMCTDAQAHRLINEIIVLASAGLVVAVIRSGITAAAGTGPETALARIALAIILGLLTIRFFFVVREPLSGVIARTGGVDPEVRERRARIGRRIAYLYMVVTAVDMFIKSLGALGLLGAAAESGSGASVLTLVIAPLGVAALRAYTHELTHEERTPARLGALALGEGAIMIGAAALLLVAWGIDPLHRPAEGGILALIPALVEVGVIVVVGVALWRAVTGVFEMKTQSGDDEGEEPNENLGEIGGSGDRLATVLPIVRGFALTLIALTTAITGLSALGVNVAPLLASAGILGLAIGFGAQTLVTDIISGLFYLYEDAIRIGEYVETSGGKGAVERISIRSATLRHPRGALVTVPFSKMGTIQNHSRDWAIMKFSFRVPADTDVEMVRKLIKKAGIELMNDPELEGKILMPLKSQGAVGITGRGYDIGCKFMATPGDQFVIRRKAFVLVQKALREKGIELAGQELDFSAMTQRPMAAE